MVTSATEYALSQMQMQRQKELLRCIFSQMQVETEIVDAYNGNPNVSKLIPGTVTRTFLDRNLQGINIFKRGLDKLHAPVSSAELQYTGEERYSTDHLEFVKELEGYKDGAILDLILSGKTAILPWINDTGELRLTPLGGFLFPIYDEYQPNKLVKLLSFSPQATNDGIVYTVYEIEFGVIRIYSDVKAVERYNSSRFEEFPQPHAADRMPVSFVSNGNGYAVHGLSAYNKFLKHLIQENQTFEQSVSPQRVITGMTPDDAAANNLHDFSPYSVIYLKDGATIDYLSASQDVTTLSAARADAAREVGTALHVPDLATGAGESGEARMILLEEQMTTCNHLARLLTALFNDVTVLLGRMKAVPNALEFSLSPNFSHVTNQKTNQVIELFKQGILSRYETLTRLQALGVPISENEFATAKQELDLASNITGSGSTLLR
jgi:hypothetical protein